jgi:molecular chaperone GrpE
MIRRIKMSRKKDDQVNPVPETKDAAGAAGAGEESSSAPENAQPTGEEKLKLEMEGLKNTYDELNDCYLRVRAEYDNFRKRSIKERESIYADALCDAVASFLPVYDNLERAMKTPTEDTAFLKGLELTHRQFTQCLEKLGVSEIPAEGKPFDPALHNAVMHVEDENLGENVVAEVFQKGFQSGDKIIRHAMVKVAN